MDMASIISQSKRKPTPAILSKGEWKAKAAKSGKMVVSMRVSFTTL